MQRPLGRARATTIAPLLTLALSALLGCARDAAPTPSSGGSPRPTDGDAPPSPPEVRASRGDLVFSYLDPLTGAFSTTSSIGAIPEAARGSVFVTDLSRSPEARQAARYVFLADLREARPDGTFPVSVASRHASAVRAAAGATATSSGVVMYTTSWCGVCRQAKAVLQRLGVPFTERDIEASRSAAEELAAKAQQAGINPGGVPVIDVGGILLQGLDEGALTGALREKGFLR